MRGPTLGASVVAGILVALVLLRPVLLAPITGDDVYYTLGAAKDPDRTVLIEINELRLEWSERVAKGRVNVLTAVERRTAGRAVLETAVATGRPAHHILAVLRIGYAALSLLAVYALLRSIRWRRPRSGGLVRLEARTLAVAMVAGTLAFAAGAQPQLVGNDGLNGWIAYPVLTWTAALSIFGVVALALWLARLTAARGSEVGLAAALLFVVVGVLTNFRSELTFVALPLTLAALAVVPVSDRHESAAGRRAKALVGSAYVVGFLPLLVANRMMLREVCASGACYEGVSLSVSPVMFKTFGINVLSSIPGTGRDEILALLRAESVPVQGAWVPTRWSVLTALGLVAALALAWRGGSFHRTKPHRDPEEKRVQAVLCLVGAAVLVLGALGAAAVMSLSRRAQEDISQVGILYRHSVVTWTGLAFALVLLVLAVGLWRPRLATRSFVALGLVLALLVATKMPADERTMAANAARMQPSTRVFAEVVRGGTSDLANQRRCRAWREVARSFSDADARYVRRASQRVFERYWHIPFCARE